MADMINTYMANQRDSGFEEEIVQVNRVSKKTKGGNKIGFSVLTVVGNKSGKSWSWSWKST